MSRRSGAKGHRDRTGSVFQLPDHGSGSDCGGVPQHSLLPGKGSTGLNHKLQDFDRRLGARLRQIRVCRGLSLPDVAQAMGISYQQLQKYESGANSLSVVKLLCIAEVLELEADVLLDLGDNDPSTTSIERAQTYGERHRLQKSYFALPEPIRLAILRLMEAEAGRTDG